MPYQYKRESLNDEVNRLTNACDTFPVKGISTRALQTLLDHDRLTTAELYLNLSPEDAVMEFLISGRFRQEFNTALRSLAKIRRISNTAGH